MNNDKTIQELTNWATNSENIRALILTSSRVGNTGASVDSFSDYDISVYVKSLSEFNNDEWLSVFGEVLVKWPLTPQSTFDEKWLTRLVMFINRVRIDFQITTNTKIVPADYDLGYLVLTDKDKITESFPIPTKRNHLISKPTEEEFTFLINEFFWDSTYVAKYLYRKDLFYAKHMLDASLREYFEKMIEWYIGSENEWRVSTNVHGRLFPKYLEKDTWNDIEQTFAGADINANWVSFYKMFAIFTDLAKKIGDKLRFKYPQVQEQKLLEYIKESEAMGATSSIQIN